MFQILMHFAVTEISFSHIPNENHQITEQQTRLDGP
jgi:hypothetical protein